MQEPTSPPPPPISSDTTAGLFTSAAWKPRSTILHRTCAQTGEGSQNAEWRCSLNHCGTSKAGSEIQHQKWPLIQHPCILDQQRQKKKKKLEEDKSRSPQNKRQKRSVLIWPAPCPCQRHRGTWNPLQVPPSSRPGLLSDRLVAGAFPQTWGINRSFTSPHTLVLDST